MSYYAISVEMYEVEPDPNQAGLFNKLTPKEQQTVKDAWRELRNKIIPPSVSKTWIGMLMSDCAGVEDAMGLACGIVGEQMRKVPPKRRPAMLPTPRFDMATKTLLDDWIPCGRNCHGGAFALGYASGDLKIEPAYLDYELNKTIWRGVAKFSVDVAALVER